MRGINVARAENGYASQAHQLYSEVISPDVIARSQNQNSSIIAFERFP